MTRVKTWGENRSAGDWETREKKRIPKDLILLCSLFEADKVRTFSVVSKAGILLWVQKRNGFIQNGILTHALSAESFKVNRPYNSSTKILVPFPQAGVSHGELEGLFAVVCCGGGWNKLIIKFESETASCLGCMKHAVSSVKLSANAEWQVLQNRAGVRSIAKVMTLWQLAVKWLDNCIDACQKYMLLTFLPILLSGAEWLSEEMEANREWTQQHHCQTEV